MAENAGTIYSDVRIQLDKLKADISGVESKINGFKNFNTTSATQTQKGWEKGFKGINLAGTAAVVALTATMKKMIGTFAQTEQSLANVRAVTGASAEEFARLEAAAEEAGRTTRFRASEAADALYYLASAGFDATQSIDALDGVLLLAGATGADLAMTSETLASAISAFNLEAGDATRVSNVFAAAIGNSQATMEKLAVSMRYVAPVASAFNQSIEGTVGLLQILYNNGFEASQAGTALRSALADLANAASPANAKLQELGVSFSEIDPQTNSYADIIDVLNKKVTDASDIMDVFGDRAGPAMIKLIQAGRGEIEKYTEAVTGTNAAAEQYAIQNDTLAGTFDMFKSAAEAASNSLIKELAPTLRDLLDIGKNVLNFFTGLPKPLKAIVGGAAAAGAAIGTLGVAFKLLGVSIGSAFGPISIALAAVSGIAVALNNATKAQREYSQNIQNMRISTDKLDSSIFDLIDEYEILKSKTELTADEQLRQNEIIADLKKNFPDLTDEVLNNATALKILAIQQAEANKAQAEANLQILKKNLDDVNKSLDKQRSGIINDIVGQWSSLGKQVQLQRSNTQEFIQKQKELREELGKLKTVEEFEKAALRLGVSIKNTGQGFIVTGEKISELKGEISNAEQKIKDYNETIKANKAELEKLNKEVETNTTAQGENASVAEQRKKLWEDYQKAVVAAEYEEQIGLTKSSELLKAQITALEKYIRGLVDTGYTQEEQISKLVAKLDEYKAKLEEVQETEKESEDIVKHQSELESMLEQARIDRMEEGAAKQQAQFKFNLNERLRALQEAGATEQQIRQEYIDATTAYEVQKEKEAAEERQRINERIRDAIVAGAMDLLNALNDLYQAQIAEQIADINQAVEDGTLTQEEAARQTAELQYKGELAEWKLKGLSIASDIARGVAQGIAWGPLVAPWYIPFAVATGAVQTATWIKQKPQPPDLATGAVILPQRGGTLVNVGENGYGEVVANLGPEGTALISELGRRVAEAGGGGNVTVQYIVDGRKEAERVSRYQNNGIVRVMPR